MPNDKTPCESCGETHDGPFPREIVDLWREILNAEEEHERFELMIMLAERFVDDISVTDEKIGEDLHRLVSNVTVSRRAFERHALALARNLMRTLPLHFSDKDPEATHTPENKSN